MHTLLKRVMQTRYGQDGNCFSACLASLLDCDLEAVDFSCLRLPEGMWFEKACEVLAPFGCTLIHINNIHGLSMPFSLCYIATGMTSRGFKHSVISRNWGMIHDPHPSNDGIDNLEYINFIVKDVRFT